MKETGDRKLLDLFIRDAMKIPLMTKEEEISVARKAFAGDVTARNRLASANLRFVLALAFRYRSSGASLTELVSAGCLGVLIAAGRFDPDVGVRFTSYAAYWIRQAMQSVVARENDSSTVSLDDPVPGDEQTTFKDHLADEGESFENALKDFDVYILLEHPDVITDRERRCLRLRYYEDRTLRQTGESLGITRTRVSQIETRALYKLRRHLACSGTAEEKALLWRRSFNPIEERI